MTLAAAINKALQLGFSQMPTSQTWQSQVTAQQWFVAAAGLGGAVAAALMKHGITHIAHLQQHSPAQLLLLLGGQQQAKLAERLLEAGWGRDAAAVVDKGAPKSIQV